MTPPASPWSLVLDDLAARVEAAWPLLADGVAPVDAGELAAWAPPAGLGTCPEPLRARALEVLQAQAELQEGLARRLDAVGREAHAGRRVGTAFAGGTAPRHRFLDERA